MIDLMPYQEEGVRLLARFGGRALLADDPGLGKTSQSYMWAHRHLTGGPVVVVCPANVKYVWETQLADHFGVRADVLAGRAATPIRPNPRGVYVTNYDILGNPAVRKTKTWVRELRRLRPKLVIIDECHLLQDVGTQRYKAVRFLCHKVPHVIAISGTPATSCPFQLWPALNLVRPDKFPSRWDFGHKFCGPKRTPWGAGWEFKGVSNAPRLNRLLRKHCMIRRTKEEVLTDLPGKIRTVVPVDIDRRPEYDTAEKDLIKWLVMRKKRSRAARAAGNERLLRVGYLRRLAAELKMRATCQWIDEFLRDTGRKLLVFGVHHDKVLDAVTDRFRGVSVRVDGKVAEGKRRLYQDAFNTDPKVRLFVGNIEAAGTGWSCRSASDVLFVELPFVPGKVTQAEDRCHGVGRGVAGQVPNVWFLVGRATYEEKLVKLLTQKQAALGSVLDGKNASRFDIMDKLEEALLEGKR